MSDWFTIRQNLRATLVGVSSLPANRAWENRRYQPNNASYVEEAMIPISEAPRSTGQIEQRGIYQVTVVVPINTGTKTAEDIIDDILAAFPPASSHSNVRVDRSERGPTFIDGHWYRLPVSVHWRAYESY